VQQQHTCNGFRGKITSLSSCEIQYRILAILNARGPLFIGWGAEWATVEICTDAVRTVNLGRPDGQLCDRIFREFRWKSFLFESRVRTGDTVVNGWTSTRNFHICYARFRTMIGSRSDGRSRIGNFHISCTRVWTKADWRPDGDIWIAILALCMCASRRETTSFGRVYQSSLILNLERIWSWSITKRRPDGLLIRPDGYRMEQ